MKKLSTWLIIAGIVIILIPLAGSLYTYYQQNQLYDEYLNSQELKSSSDTSVLKQTDDPILTLITCAPKGSNTHRLIIHAQQTH